MSTCICGHENGTVPVGEEHLPRCVYHPTYEARMTAEAAHRRRGAQAMREQAVQLEAEAAEIEAELQAALATKVA